MAKPVVKTFANLLISLIISVALTAVFAWSVMDWPEETFDIVWQQSSSEPSPPSSARFKILAFPRQMGTPVYDESGEVAGKLNRAVILDIEEWQSGNDLEVYLGDLVVYLKREDATLTPDSAQPQNLLDNLQKEIVAWGDETDWREVVWSIDSGKAILTLVHQEGGRTQYTYQIDGRIPRPAKVASQSALKYVFEQVGYLIGVTILFTIIFIICLLVVWWIRKSRLDESTRDGQMGK